MHVTHTCTHTHTHTHTQTHEVDVVRLNSCCSLFSASKGARQPLLCERTSLRAGSRRAIFLWLPALAVLCLTPRAERPYLAGSSALTHLSQMSHQGNQVEAALKLQKEPQGQRGWFVRNHPG